MASPRVLVLQGLGWGCLHAGPCSYGLHHPGGRASGNSLPGQPQAHMGHHRLACALGRIPLGGRGGLSGAGRIPTNSPPLCPPPHQAQSECQYTTRSGASPS